MAGASADLGSPSASVREGDASLKLDHNPLD